jgi:DNA-binding NarL/FixJ family response regulator
MNKPIKPIRVVLADDHKLVRAGIRALLEKLPGVEVLGEASNGREVLNLVGTHRPDVVLMDIAMPGLNGLAAAARVVQEFPDVRVIMLSMHDNEEYCWRALKVGAVGYLLKKVATTELETALLQVVQGKIYLSQEIATRLVQRFFLQEISGQKSPLEQMLAQ